MRKRLAMPDGMRVFAIGLIMWFHIWQQSWLAPETQLWGIHIDLTPAVRTGYIMVDIMLMLSGYLLFLPIARGEKINAGRFYAKRLIRILPCYLLCVFVVFFAFALPNGYAHSGAMWKDLITHLTFTHTFFHDTYAGTQLNGVLWTLAIEMQFYLIFPLIAALFKKYPLRTYMLMTIGAIIFRKYCVSGRYDIEMYINQLPAMLDVYANGMLAALITANIEKTRETFWRKLFSTAMLLFAFWAIIQVMNMQYAVSFPMEARRQGQLDNRFILSAAGALALVFGESSFLFIRHIFGNRLTRFLSAISFNAYMWHQLMAVKLLEWKIPNYISENPNSVGEMPWQLNYTIVCLLSAIILSVLIYYLFERPISKKLTEICTVLY